MKRHLEPEARKRADAFLNASMAYLYPGEGGLLAAASTREQAYVASAENLARWVAEDLASPAVIRAYNAACEAHRATEVANV